MKFVIDKKTGKPRVEFDKEELKERKIIQSDAREIREMQATRGWKAMERWFQRGKDSVISELMDGVSTKEKAELSNFKAAILKGFDLCMGIAGQVLAKDEVIEQEKEDQKEQEHGANELNTD